MAVYAAIVSLINTLNRAQLYDPIEVGNYASEYRVFVSHYMSGFPQDRKALETVFRAANKKDLLANNSFLERDKVNLFWESMIRFLYHYKFYHFRQIKEFKRFLCLVEAFLKDTPLMNENDEKQIQTLAHEGEDLIDSLTSTMVMSRLYQIEKEFKQLIERTRQYDCGAKCTNDFVVAGYSLCSSSSPITPRLENSLVGFDHYLIKIKEQLTRFPHGLSIISVVGMGGIWKTTLTRVVYDDPCIEHHFYICAWIAVSRGYEVRKMLLGILNSVSRCTNEMYTKSDEELAEQLYRSLKGRRYLIVLDDIWDIEAWNDVRRSFPDDNNGSRIIFTSRHTKIASHVYNRSLTHDIHLLNMDQRLKLLSLKVFGKNHSLLNWRMLENKWRENVKDCHLQLLQLLAFWLRSTRP